MTQLIATTMHIPSDEAPIRLAVGERVRVVNVDRVWPEFVFVIAAHGVGWLPLNNLSIARPHATVRTPYDTRELAVHAGMAVELVHRDAGSSWAWCRTDDGSEGWLSLSSLEKRAGSHRVPA